MSALILDGMTLTREMEAELSARVQEIKRRVNGVTFAALAAADASVAQVSDLRLTNVHRMIDGNARGGLS